MKIMSYANLPLPSSNDALVIQDNTTDTTKHVLVHDFISVVYPIGSVYVNATNSANPSSLLGFGTWVSFGTGQVMVGIDSSQTEFNTIGKTGGAKTVSLNGDQNGPHSHGVYDPGHSHGLQLWGSNNEVVTNDRDIEWSQRVDIVGRQTEHAWTGIGIYSSGSGSPHNNLQPYITVYMWKRTA